MTVYIPKHTFLDYMSNRRLFVALEVKGDEHNRLAEFSRSNGLFNNKTFSNNYVKNAEDLLYHMTLWYSKTGWLSGEPFRFTETTVEVENWDLLGRNKEHLTLKLKPNEEVNRIRNEYGKQGLTSEWGSFKPHLTMVYHYNKPKIPRIAPPKTITFSHVVIKEEMLTEEGR